MAACISGVKRNNQYQRKQLKAYVAKAYQYQSI